jgi:hypothetical protein|nr:MAG TPA: HICA protein [Caudoviricetes sp.]
MDKLKKIQADILQGHKDSNIRFSDLQKLLVAMGGRERVKGDHFIYSFMEIEAIINIQPDGKMAKPYQIRQIRKFMLENNLLIRG